MIAEQRKTDTGYRPVPPSPGQAGELGRLLAPHEGLYVSFQDHDALALNPGYGNEVTPRAVYGFPVSWILARAARHAVAADPAATAFAGIGFTQRANAFVFSVEGRVLDTRAYRCFRDDQARLLAARAADAARFDDVVASITRHAAPGGGPDDARRLWLMTERVADRLLGLSRDGNGPAAHPGKPEAWRALFRDMGFAALDDGDAMMTGDYPRQVAVFDDAAIRLRAAFENPCGPEEAPAPRP